MKISVVIPAHNEEKYIAKTLEAVLKQDYPDFEVIVVCNACTDKTEEIAISFPVKVIQEARKGTMWARERGREEATGEIIATVDADCLPDPGWLTKGMLFFNDSKTVAVTGPYDYYDASKFVRWSSLWFQKIIYTFIHHIFQPYSRGIIIEGNALFRARALEKIHGFDTSFTFYGDDTDTARRISAIGKITFDRNFIMKTSARRLKNEGALKISFLYIFHFFKETFSSKSVKMDSTNS